MKSWALVLVLFMTGCGKAPAKVEGATSELVVPDRAGIFTEATRHYGPLVVREGDYDAEADERPWAGYWYPLKDDLLVAASSRNGGRPTLAKFDAYARAVLGKQFDALGEEKRSHLYNPMAANWEGRCGAWAIASVMEPEPALPAAGFGIPGTDLTFFTRDVKALVIKSYESVDNSAFRRFGQVYNGDPGDDYQDIYPDQFHRVMQAELFDRHRAFVMDDTAGVEVWNTPVWKAVLTLTRDPADARVMHVYARIKGAQSVNISPDASGWAPSNDTTYQYTYDLIGKPQPDGSLLVKYGRWTVDTSRGIDSVTDHPDFVLTLPDKGVSVRHASANHQLDGDVVRDILDRTGALRARGL